MSTTKTRPLPMSADPRRGSQSDVDARFTFANERTLLAWNRTALALVAGGLALAGFTGGAGALPALPLMAFGAFLAFGSYRRWRLNDVALRTGRPLPASALPRTLAYGVVAIAVTAVLVAVLHSAGL